MIALADIVVHDPPSDLMRLLTRIAYILVLVAVIVIIVWVIKKFL